MLWYVITHLIAAALRPLLWAALAVLSIAFVITVPARLWLLYVDPGASARTIAMLHWATGVLLVGLLLAGRTLPLLGRMLGRMRRRQVAPHRSRSVGARRLMRH